MARCDVDVEQFVDRDAARGGQRRLLWKKTVLAQPLLALPLLLPLPGQRQFVSAGTEPGRLPIRLNPVVNPIPLSGKTFSQRCKNPFLTGRHFEKRVWRYLLCLLKRAVQESCPRIRSRVRIRLRKN